MKKKFIPGLLLLALTAGGFSTFTSCKDTDEDLYINLRGEQVSLQAALDALKEQLANCGTNCQNEIKRLEDLINGKPGYTESEIKGWITDLTNQYATQEALKQLADRVAALEGKEPGGNDQFKPEDVTTLTDLIAIADQLKALVGENGTVNTLSTEIENLKKVLNGDGTNPGLLATVSGLEAWFENIGLTVDEFQTYVKQGEFVLSNKAALEALVKLQNDGTLNEDALKALNEVYADLAGIDEMYNTIFKGVEAPADGWWNYAEVMQNIKNNSAAIAELQDEVDAIFNRINDLVTSLILQSASNHLYGTFNTPFGINSMVLMANFGHLAIDLNQFPVSAAKDMGAECYSDSNIDWSSITSDKYDLTSTILAYTTNNGQATLGNLWFTVNPGTVNHLDKAGFELVNSRDEVSKVNLVDITKDDETLIQFGVNSNSRAAGNGNGLYRAEATVAVDDLDAIKVNIESGLAQALKDAVKNHTAADMAHLLKAIYSQLQNVCDANALRYTYEAISGKGGATSTQKVYSNYGLAATAFKPLSFATLKGESFHKLPTIDPIEIDKSLVDLGLKPFEIGDVKLDVELDLGKIEFDEVGETIIEVKVPSHFNENGEADAWTYEKVNITGDLQQIVDKLQASVNEWFEGKVDEPSLNEKLQSQIEAAVDSAFNGPDGLIASIENQVNDMMGSIQDKLDNLVDQINKDYLNKVNKLIDKYNSIADRINKVLSDPNHYLQSVMFIRKADGNLGFLSTNAKQPSQFKGNGEAIELFATTYNFETVCPAFKKIVGVVKVTDQNGNENTALKNAANASMAKVLDGRVNRVALDVRGAKGGVFTYEIAYQAMDFTGHTSTVKCYVQVIR
ncbi:hypothetical protein E7747_02165 [Duncaniella dubosii]|uniref:Uncharacterized protein n=1 Tax=Duncaniella dubosii TaxID=2518971 RepID=A0A4P7W0F3_9BACT|nr:hypothetical protein [Duncaniella dubosii]QCD41217.1 hypothetical protein E7747_02165 [Duncaniella dubosii]